MASLIPGGRFKRFGDTLFSTDPSISRPSIRPLRTTGNLASDSIFRKKIANAGADISRTAPTFNDPRYSFTTLSIPTDLRTLNGLYRFFDDTDPVVGNCLRLHTEFPLSRISLKSHGDPVIQAHFEDMWQRINMEKLLFDAALEYWRIGNVFLFGAWNPNEFMWNQFVILNPDYVTVEGTYLNQRPFIKLQPDEHLKKIITTGQPKFLFDQLPKEIIKYVRMGQEIPLSANNTFHLAHNKAPYETLGRSIIKRILKSLIYEDRMSMANFAIATRQTIPITVVKVGDPASGWLPSDDELETVREMLSAREVDPNFCHDKETECLTDQGWVKFDELTLDHKVGSFDPIDNSLKYLNPTAINVQDYSGEMYHFKSRKLDIKVTPNHRMWVKRDGEWQVVLASEVKESDVFRTCVDKYESPSPLPPTLTIAGTEVDTGDFFEFIGWYISEGSIGGASGVNGVQYTVYLSQTENGSLDELSSLIKKLPWSAPYYQGSKAFAISSRTLVAYMVSQFGKGAAEKKLPQWVIDAQPEYLERLLRAYILGDGTTVKTGRGEFYQTHTASRQLSGALQKIGLHLGYCVDHAEKQPTSYVAPHSGVRHYKKADGSDLYLLHRLNFSKDDVSRFPKLKRRKDYNSELKPLPVLDFEIPKKGKRVDWDNVDLENILGKTGRFAPQAADLLGCSVGTVLTQMEKVGIAPQRAGTRASKYEETGNISREKYVGKIWCATVPTGIMITRRNGNICISGNSIVYHWGIDIQFYGAAGRIWNLTNEFNRIMKWKLMGLGISESLLTGAGSYSSAYAQLEVLRQRYLHFQNALQAFVYKGVFEPVAKQCGFYKTDQTVAGKYYSGQKYGKEGTLDLSGVSIAEHAEKYANPENLSFRKRFGQHQGESSMTQLEYPKLDWDLLSLSNDVQYRNFLMNFDKLFPGQRKISDSTFYMAAKLDRDTERMKLKTEYEQNMEDQLEKGKVTKKYMEKFAKEGIPFPGAQQPGQQGQQPGPGGSPGPGGMKLAPGAVPPVGGTGGGNLMGSPGGVPNAPVGKGNFQGAEGAPSADPLSATRSKSQQLHSQLTRASHVMMEENDEEVRQLRELNKLAGIDIASIDEEIKKGIDDSFIEDV